MGHCKVHVLAKYRNGAKAGYGGHGPAGAFYGLQYLGRTNAAMGVKGSIATCSCMRLG
ncbi:MAG: hypothetical protein P0Y53_06545 [Candidatus Pseudobacter hemicellulosilyticus]|uniref:Uncharacterized protein n=1 Tax=Candidatus Pseudobacter hemicellulosilyticus TaxID=3121375 RepID=A0AAJ5WVX1_9BACT|nr:MAG: hypothetical protein P0Y53_06545 [Pseudobacter sp.]